MQISSSAIYIAYLITYEYLYLQEQKQQWK